MSAVYAPPIVTIFGGSGFVGKQIVEKLARAGWILKIASRIPEKANALKVSGHPGQIVPVFCDYSDPQSIAAAVAGADMVVNCIGILFEKRKGGFHKAHVAIPQDIAKACKKHSVKRLVHISALGVDKASSDYAASKREGERTLRKSFPALTILRPSVIFGPDDNFFNMFARLARLSPVLPLIGGGKTKFQPVYVGDVAAAIYAALTNPKAPGQIYELGGPDILTFREIYERLFLYTNRRRMLLPLPFGLAKIQAFFMERLPTPLLTRDQVESLKTDNIVSETALTLKDLDIEPTSIAIIMPSCLVHFCPGGRRDEKKGASPQQV